MLTQSKLEALLEAHQKHIDGVQDDKSIPNEWVSDLLVMLTDMALRNEVLQAEIKELRRELGSERSE